MKTAGWQEIYIEKGIVQEQPLPKIYDAINIFKGKGFTKILDLGCGTGRHSIVLAEHGFTVYASDISKKGINLAEKQAALKGLQNINFRIHDMKELPFEDSYFDAVICFLSIDHGSLADIKKTISEVYRVLKPGSIFLVDFISIDDETWGKGIMIEENTFLNSIPAEKEIIHHYASLQELETLFKSFSQLNVVPKTTLYGVEVNNPHYVQSLEVEGIK